MRLSPDLNYQHLPLPGKLPKKTAPQSLHKAPGGQELREIDEDLLSSDMFEKH